MASKHNKTPADIRESHFRRRLPIAIAARIPDMKRICAEWHNRFGACLTLDRERLNACCDRLVDGGWALDAVLAAIEAYHQLVSTDAWHQANPKAVRSLASFLRCEQFETYARDGLGARQVAQRQAQSAQAKADQAAIAKTAETHQVAEAHALMAAFQALSPTEQRDLLQDAYNALSQPLKDVVKASGKTGLASPLIRAGVFAELKRSAVSPTSPEREARGRPLNPPVAGLLLCVLAFRCLAFAAPAPTSQPAAYYVARQGSMSGDGSQERPWPSVEVALEKIGGGKKIVVKPGDYPRIKLYAAASGSPGAPTVIVSEVKWKARIVGPHEHGIYSPEDDAARALHDVVLDGFEIDGGNHDAIPYDGLHFVRDQRIVVRNCWVHHARHMGVALHECDDSVIERCLIEQNGTDGSTGVPQHHGVYASGQRLLIQSNVVRGNSGFGLHLYERLGNSLVTRNLVVDHLRGTGIMVQSTGGNQITFNTVVRSNIGIAVRKGKNERILGNIIVESISQTLLMPVDTSESVFDWNLCDVLPTPNMALVYSGVGPHNLRADPQFVDRRGVFYLKSNSPARLGTNFPAGWTLPDLGAFSYDPALEKVKAPVVDWWN